MGEQERREAESAVGREHAEGHDVCSSLSTRALEGRDDAQSLAGPSVLVSTRQHTAPTGKSL